MPSPLIAVFIVAFGLASSGGAGFQNASTPPAAPPGAAQTCMTLLTDAEVRKVVSGTPKIDKEIRRIGRTGCHWVWDGPTGMTFVRLYFIDHEGLKDAQMSLAGNFEATLKTLEKSSGKRAEPLSGLGQRAVALRDDLLHDIVVQRSDGVAHLMSMNLSTDQVLTLASAIVTP